MFDIRGCNAVVTGANRGIGRAVAEGYAKAGANVAIIDLEVSAETVKTIESYGVRCSAYQFDLSRCEEIEALAEQIITEQDGRIDILYNNAGTQRRYPCTDFPQSEWDFVMNVNSKAVFFLCQSFGRHMLGRGYGKIINTASLLSFQGGRTVPALSLIHI